METERAAAASNPAASAHPMTSSEVELMETLDLSFSAIRFTPKDPMTSSEVELMETGVNIQQVSTPTDPMTSSEVELMETKF